MQIHFMNCGTMHPRGAAWFLPHLSKVPCLCLLIEGRDSLILVDTGFGTRDMIDPRRLGHAAYLLNATCDVEQTAVRQIERMGFAPQDVRHIICTHLDRDHAGGLSDFPQAQVHVTVEECAAALKPQDFRERDRYRPCHFAHSPQWTTHAGSGGEPWFGLPCLRDLPGLPPEIVLVPLPGHTRGHCGVAVDTGEGWILHCGDAYYIKHEVREDQRTPLGVQAFRRVAHCDYSRAMHRIEDVRTVLRRGQGTIRIMASHDQFEYRAIFEKPLD